MDDSERDRFVPDAPVRSDLHEHNRTRGVDVREAIELSYRDAVGVPGNNMRGSKGRAGWISDPSIHKIENIDAPVRAPAGAIRKAVLGVDIISARLSVKDEREPNHQQGQN